MQTYSALIRLAGSRENEARRSGLTAPEMYLLEHIHGPDSLSDVVPLGEIECVEHEERERLVLTYGHDDGTPRLHQVFGVAGPLPTVFKGVEFIEAEPAPQRRTSAKKAAPDAVAKAASATQAAAELMG